MCVMHVTLLVAVTRCFLHDRWQELAKTLLPDTASPPFPNNLVGVAGKRA